MMPHSFDEGNRRDARSGLSRPTKNILTQERADQARKEPAAESENYFDVAIIGGGFAGLSAALMLSRYLIPTVLFDGGKPKNWNTNEVNGYLGLNGISPRELIRRSWSEISKYRIVNRVKSKVKSASEVPNRGIFSLQIEDGSVFHSKYIVLATGVLDVKPLVKNFAKFEGSGIWHCPHCDGMETRGKKLSIIAKDVVGGINYAKEFLGWTREISLFVHDASAGHPRNETQYVKEIDEARELGIELVIDDPVEEIVESRGKLRGVRTLSGRSYDSDVLFYNLGTSPQNAIAIELGCELDQGCVKVNNEQKTSAPRVYAAGDIDTDRQYVALATAAGARAAISIYEEMLKEAIKKIMTG